ncbi:MAG: glycosyl hydrolase [Bacteroidota bacterium]
MRFAGAVERGRVTAYCLLVFCFIVVPLMQRLAHILPLLCALALLVVVPALAQVDQVGQGSYATVLPSGEVGPSLSSGAPAVPLVSADFDQPIQTNDFWSSLLFPFFGDQHSGVLYAHPISAKAVASGLQIGYTATPVFAANDYIYPHRPQLTVGVKGLSTGQAVADGYGDWTVTAQWTDGVRTLNATLGHGQPFVFFEAEGGNARIALSASPTVWLNDGHVLGITVDGRHYGIFGPSGSDWSTADRTLTSPLGGQTYFSVALLPDASTATLDRFRARAYAFVTDSRVAWQYDEATSRVQTTYSYATELKESGAGQLDETLTALYRHQWRHTPDALTEIAYASPRGQMRLLEGNTFTTDLRFDGILPTLPDRGAYSRSQLRGFVRQVARQSIGVGPTYDNGKEMGRMARLVHIADQLERDRDREAMLDELKARLEDWLTAGGDQQYVYNDTWNVLTGYPSDFFADSEINDHHFHSGYAVMTAATIAQYDPEWAAQENWGGMVNLLIRDASNWDRTDTRFPFLRNFDAYAGHAWASGHGAFGDGNNQESSSESMHFATAVILWGEMTGQQAIRDLGVYLYATEASAIEQYWFDVEDATFPVGYNRTALGIVWGGKGAHTTWFGQDPEFIHGINILPLTSGSMYLGRHPDYVSANYDAVVRARGSEPTTWKDVFWQYLAFSEPDRALELYLADPNYRPFDGESRAHTLHWLHNMAAMGRLDPTVTADVATYSVFRSADGVPTYVAFNAGDAVRTVTFSDGFTLEVPARSLASGGKLLAPTGLAPDGDTEGIRSATLNWDALDGASGYDVEVAADEAFANVIASVSTGAATTSTIVADLDPATTYQWRVRGTNALGPGAWTAATFTTALNTSIRSDDLPTEYRLHGNYPNPFNPSTEIRFDLPEAAAITLDVYDAMGRRIERLIEATLVAGTHAATFNAARRASGLYLYRLKTPAFTATQRMVLLK